MLRYQPWKSYRQIATQTAPPGQLILMLFDGVLRFLRLAHQGFDIHDVALSNMTVHNNIVRAQEILRELDNSLDLTQGGECAATLRSLYRYFDERLSQSNIQKDPEGIQEVIARVTVLRDAWSTMLSNPAEQVTAAPQATLTAAFA